MTSVMGATASSQLPIASAAASEPAIGKEFNSFIKLLIAQMRNQDPLAPIDSTQFVQQLATFSSLEQQVNSNTQLGSIDAVGGRPPIIPAKAGTHASNAGMDAQVLKSTFSSPAVQT